MKRLGVQGHNIKPDRELIVLVMQALRANHFLPANSLQVGLSLGWVTLMGEVESVWQRQLAESTVKDIEGVKGVTNRIAINPFQPKIYTPMHLSDSRSANTGRGASPDPATRQIYDPPQPLLLVKDSGSPAQFDSDQDTI